MFGAYTACDRSTCATRSPSPQAWVMGWSTDGKKCRSGSFPYGPNGAWVNTVTQGTAGYSVQFLCKAKGASTATRHAACTSKRRLACSTLQLSGCMR